MTLRIVSGIIRPLLVGGRVRITFLPHQIMPSQPFDQARLIRRREIGPQRPYASEPAATVAIRQFQFSADPFIPGPKRQHIIINDQSSSSEMTVSWRVDTSGGLILVEEIAYMVVGEVV